MLRGWDEEQLNQQWHLVEGLGLLPALEADRAGDADVFEELGDVIDDDELDDVLDEQPSSPPVDMRAAVAQLTMPAMPGTIVEWGRRRAGEHTSGAAPSPQRRPALSFITNTTEASSHKVCVVAAPHDACVAAPSTSAITTFTWRGFGGFLSSVARPTTLAGQEGRLHAIDRLL